jgi:hypothetical protein
VRSAHRSVRSADVAHRNPGFFGRKNLRRARTSRTRDMAAVPLRAPTFHENPTPSGSEISSVFLEILRPDEGMNGEAVEIMGDFPFMVSRSKHS